MNSTCRTPFELETLLKSYLESPAHIWLVGFGFSILVLLGVLANAGVVTVFSTKYMRHVAMNLLLRALGISDILFLVFFWMNQVIFPALGWINGHQRGPPARYRTVGSIGQYVSYPCMKMFYTSSTWLVAVASLERYLAICHPFKQSCLREPRTANLSIGAIFVLAFLINIPSFVRFQLLENPVLNVTEVAPRMEYEHAISKYYVVVRTVFHFALPFTILIVCNGMTACAIRKMQKFHQTGISNVMRSEMKTGTMFIAYGAMFILCQTWPTGHYFLSTFAFEWYHYCVSQMNLVLKDLEHFLLILNCLCSLLIYLKYGSKFRSVFLHVFCSRVRPEFKLCEPTASTRSRTIRMSAISKGGHPSHESRFTGCTSPSAHLLATPAPEKYLRPSSR